MVNVGGDAPEFSYQATWLMFMLAEAASYLLKQHTTHKTQPEPQQGSEHLQKMKQGT
jgi:hypothetical protein